ncbi:MAG: hypothetical protein PVJ42_03615 [bacterium]
MPNSPKMNVRRIACGLVSACCVALAVAGCGDGPGGTRVANMPPDTHVSSGPADGSESPYRTAVHWYGTDSDGDVVGFEVAVIRGLGREDPADPEALLWTPTASTESIFVVAADSCCYGGSSRHDPQYAGAYWGILIRSVDNEGARDESPAGVFFLASTLVPRVSFVVPYSSYGLQTVGAHAYLAWKGEDPDGEDERLSYKYLVVPGRMRDDLWDGGIPPLEYEGSGDAPHMSPDLGVWSEWVPADCTYVSDLDLSAFMIGRASYDTVYAYVTVRDQAGAVLPVELFELYNWEHNIRALRVIRYSGGVKVIIDGGNLGVVESFHCGGSAADPPAIFEGTPVRFIFYGDEGVGLGHFVESYRYYLDDPNGPASTWSYWTGVAPIRDPAADPQWKVRYPADGGEFSPSLGLHVFGVELRDMHKDTTCAEIYFDVIPGPEGLERNILLVDDERLKWWEGSLVADYEDREFEMWAAILDGYDWQEWDTGPAFQDQTPVRLVGSATTVIWSVDRAFYSMPDLLGVCARRGNYLHSYVKAGGNLIVIGMSPIYCTMFWPDGYPGYNRRIFMTNLQFPEYHFMSDVFGIDGMELRSYSNPSYVSSMVPAPGYYDWPEIAAKPRGDVRNWPGFFDEAFLVSGVRAGADVHPVYAIDHVLNPGAPESTWTIETDPGRLAAVYVEGDGKRGGAAYICLPAWWLERDGTAEMIRMLLDLFGESPVK